jgi:hypothetical protein
MKREMQVGVAITTPGDAPVAVDDVDEDPEAVEVASKDVSELGLGSIEQLDLSNEV